jgi:hypothetical protein
MCCIGSGCPWLLLRGGAILQPLSRINCFISAHDRDMKRIRQIIVTATCCTCPAHMLAVQVLASEAAAASQGG